VVVRRRMDGSHAIGQWKNVFAFSSCKAVAKLASIEGAVLVLKLRFKHFRQSGDFHWIIIVNASTETCD